MHLPAPNQGITVLTTCHMPAPCSLIGPVLIDSNNKVKCCYLSAIPVSLFAAISGQGQPAIGTPACGIMWLVHAMDAGRESGVCVAGCPAERQAPTPRRQCSGVSRLIGTEACHFAKLSSANGGHFFQASMCSVQFELFTTPGGNLTQIIAWISNYVHNFLRCNHSSMP